MGASDKSQISSVISSLERQNRHEMAAAFALFHFDRPRAVQALIKGSSKHPNSNLQLVALALSGFGDGGSSSSSSGVDFLSTTGGANIIKSMNPYLAACFRFLSTSAAATKNSAASAPPPQPDYSLIVNDDSLRLCDRVGFACRFLNDDDLVLFLDKTVHHCIRTGKLEGMLLTGLTYFGLELLSSYVGWSGDVQTAALLSLHALGSMFSHHASPFSLSLSLSPHTHTQ